MISSTLDVNWELRETGPTGARHGVLLLPGGACSAAFYKELTAEFGVATLEEAARSLSSPGRGESSRPWLRSIPCTSASSASSSPPCTPPGARPMRWPPTRESGLSSPTSWGWSRRPSSRRPTSP